MITTAQRKHPVRLVAGVAISLTVTGWGCLSMQSQSTLDAANGAGGSNQPFVEAYIEYPGPQAKWSGPASFILHVTAKDAGPAQITTTPELATADKPAALPTAPSDHSEDEVSQRAPAASGLAHMVTPFRNMSSDEARSQLAYLANSLQGAQAPFRGCMSPVRVRLVRANGSLLERLGCRSELGWSRAVSESVSTFVDASINGMPAKTSTEPTRAISSVTAAPAAPGVAAPAAAHAEAAVAPATEHAAPAAHAETAHAEAAAAHH
jgi:hypothetical protein